MAGADILAELRSGAAETLDRLVPVVYAELRGIAHRQLAVGGRGGTLSTTALVHEAYMKLVDQSQTQWRDRAHFVGVAALAMRHVLVDRANARRRLKRGGGQRHFSLDEEHIGADDQPDALLELDEALNRLAALDPRLARVVEYRFLAASPRTRLRRRWALPDAPYSVIGRKRASSCSAHSSRDRALREYRARHVVRIA